MNGSYRLVWRKGIYRKAVVFFYGFPVTLYIKYKIGMIMPFSRNDQVIQKISAERYNKIGVNNYAE